MGRRRGVPNVDTWAEAFELRVLRGPGCWGWDGSLNANGYGLLTHKGVRRLAYIVSYELFVGPVPDGLDLDHVCHVAPCVGGPTCPHRRCVNPAHLEPVPRAENLRRGRAARGMETHCGKGHEWTPENTYERTDGGSRGCRRCRADAAARLRERRRTDGS